ncbi:polysaccharide deacetylase family protein [Tropicimonas isoalkanivorans]|uniref:Chitooligosaccharide deacetylase n=1 Tax=Tropicimonas isoalkanivorans TaxID=441112 RepID=A0A1I1KP13_9RHOB|nr:polysaccharide deacetylase family protein [Tropicimonas isoalkanivorans]SFC62654.1 Polysaccharide deacetylase [Tropicimonas isoalkanivorans]
MSAIPDSYFDYPLRGKGYDHDRYTARYLRDLPMFEWDGGDTLKLWVCVHLEHFPMDMPASPVKPIGGMDRPYPSVWDFSTRDYGSRVGIYRLFDVLDRYGIRATAAMNSVLATRYPTLMDDILKRDWEVAAAGVDMGHLHHSQLSEDEEAALVGESFDTLRKVSGQGVTGWHSPAHSQSAATPDLVAEAGAKYICDWINDDMPYAFKTRAGTLTQMPLSYDLSDHKIIGLQNMPIGDYEYQLGAAFDVLRDESRTRGGRILSMSLSPWAIAQPGRIGALERLLSRFMNETGVGSATGEDLRAQWVALGLDG